MKETVRCNVNVNVNNVGSRDAHILLINVVLVCYLCGPAIHVP